MEYLEYGIVALLVLAASAYATLRIRRALQGRGGCSFMQGGDTPCTNCPGVCDRPDESAETGAEEADE